MSRPPRDPDPLELLRDALAGLRYGEIVVAVHDGEIVQISRTEKIRPRVPPTRPREVLASPHVVPTTGDPARRTT
jgi:hypothetical protein